MHQDLAKAALLCQAPGAFQRFMMPPQPHEQLRATKEPPPLARSAEFIYKNHRLPPAGYRRDAESTARGAHDRSRREYQFACSCGERRRQRSPQDPTCACEWPKVYSFEEKECNDCKGPLRARTLTTAANLYTRDGCIKDRVVVVGVCTVCNMHHPPHPIKGGILLRQLHGLQSSLRWSVFLLKTSALQLVSAVAVEVLW